MRKGNIGQMTKSLHYQTRYSAMVLMGEDAQKACFCGMLKCGIFRGMLKCSIFRGLCDNLLLS